MNWPRKEQRDRAFRDWLSFVTTENESAVMACADRYLASDEVSRGVVKHLHNWLEQQHRDKFDLKNETGEIIGKFARSAVIGWWKKDE